VELLHSEAQGERLDEHKILLQNTPIPFLYSICVPEKLGVNQKEETKNCTPIKNNAICSC
jgi:hypothetical protein